MELIGTVEQAVVGGAEISTDLSQRFQDVKASTQNVSNMVLEIREASSEQAHGISQVNMAIMQMDRITQTNAATAEETARSASQLSNQASGLIRAIKQLSALFGVAQPQKSLANSAAINQESMPLILKPPEAKNETQTVTTHQDPQVNDENSKSLEDSGFVRF